MIETLEITNFKSVKHLTLPCKRFNVFIGEPNTGKSNLLEALGLLSFVGAWQYQPGIKLDGFVRHERTSNLFYDEEVGEPLRVRCDDASLELAYRDGCYRGEFTHDEQVVGEITGGQQTISGVCFAEHGGVPAVRFYRSPAVNDFWESPCDFLLPPHGANLPTLLLKNRDLRHWINLPYQVLGLRLGLRPQENRIEVLKSFDDIIISYPYSQASETLRRFNFYDAALHTNTDSVLVFEEPEVHLFPAEVNFLAERIERHEGNNQFFMTTHSPDFLITLLCKTAWDKLGINIVYNEDYQTRVKQLSPEQMTELHEVDVFFNLERYLKPWLYT